MVRRRASRTTEKQTTAFQIAVTGDGHELEESDVP